MNFLKKTIGVLGVVIMLLMTISCKQEEKNEPNKDMTFNKDFLRIQLYDQIIPNNYELIDWDEKARLYDELVFDKDLTGQYLPLIWEDETYDSFGLPAYVGDGRMHQNGAQEAVTNIAAVLSATLMGIDKSESKDYVAQLSAFYSEEEGIILNNPAGSSETTSMWYLLYPTLLFAHVSSLYPEHEEIRNQTLKSIESWYEAYLVMYNDGEPSFDYTGFNFNTGKPYKNGIWTEPDSAVGIGLLMYYGYELTGEEKYLNASIETMNYIEGYFGSPLYEALMYFGPYLAAKLNALHGTDFDITNALDRVFNGASIPRGGWGSIVGEWGEYDMNGLFGSTTDGGGYAFAMNTFAGAGAIVPMVQYDARYARSIGIWMLQVASNSRYFYATETNPTNQSCTYVEACEQIDSRIKDAIPYEGIRKDSQGRRPWFGGDPTVYGWAETDFSLYSGAHVGVFASLIEETNVEKVLKLNLQATQFYNEHDFPSYLIYNPHKESKTIKYHVRTEGPVDLYDTTKNRIIKTNVTNVEDLEISADDAIVIVEIPSGSSIEQDGHNYYVNNKFISRDLITINISGKEKNETVSGTFSIQVDIKSNFETQVKEVQVQIDDEVLVFSEDEEIVIDTNNFTPGTKKIWITVQSADDLIDKNSIRLRFK
jgi:hypothetical protein